MNGTVWQLALRRWAGMFRSPALYLIFFTLVVGITIIGPSGIFGEKSFFERLGFSIVSNTICWGLGIFITPLVRIFLEMRGASRFAAAAIGSLISMLVIFPVFVSLMTNFTGNTIPHMRLVEMSLLVTTLILAIAYGILRPEPVKRAEDNQAEVPPSCPILEKIPAEKRGTLLAMVAQDHYVEVITDKGSQLILMRLSDAIAMCQSQLALQIHRSAWVTADGIKGIKKDGRKLIVVLPKGRELPVARSAEQSVQSFVERFDNQAIEIAI